MSATDAERRAKNADRMRRYRAGYRSPWGRGRPPNTRRLALDAARRLLRSVMDDHGGGWSVFDELDDAGQEAANDLSRYLAALAPEQPE